MTSQFNACNSPVLVYKPVIVTRDFTGLQYPLKESYRPVKNLSLHIKPVLLGMVITLSLYQICVKPV